MKEPKRNWPTNPMDAGYHQPVDTSALDYFTGPSDPIDYKDGRKLTESEASIRLIAYLDQFGSEAGLKN